MPKPLDYLVEMKELDDDAHRLILHENAEALNAPRPV
jgi:hypothetical protein